MTEATKEVVLCDFMDRYDMQYLSVFCKKYNIKLTKKRIKSGFGDTYVVVANATFLQKIIKMLQGIQKRSERLDSVQEKLGQALLSLLDNVEAHNELH